MSNLQLDFEDYFSPEPGIQTHIMFPVMTEPLTVLFPSTELIVYEARINTSNDSPVSVFSMQYLHILHGHNVHPTLGSSLD